MIGVGLRHAHFATLLAARARGELAEVLRGVDFLEIHAENWFGEGGADWAVLNALRSVKPISCHGVGLSLGTADGIDPAHLNKFAQVVARAEPFLVSDHLCWGHAHGHHHNDLLPLPFTEEALQLVARHVDQVQTRLKRTLLVENISRYVEFNHSTLSECAFLAELSRRTGCGVLLDVNNLYVNQINHGTAALAEMQYLAPEMVAQIHLAGHTARELGGKTMLIDTHSTKVAPAVWSLYAAAVKRYGDIPSLIEWDNDLPAWEALVAEATRARQVQGQPR